ncbi:MAG: DUF1015 family protein [Acidimicrobiales bacterium]
MTSSIHPFAGYVVAAPWASRVVGPAYDALTGAERRALADADPLSFFNVVRSTADHPGASAEELLAANASALEHLLRAGVYTPTPPALHLYRLTAGDRRQIGVVAEVDVEEYRRGRIRAHEATIRAKEDALLEHLSRVRVSSSPVCLTYRARPDIDELVGRLSRREADLTFSTSDGLVQDVWTIADPADQQALAASFARLSAAYITDGHHRAAAAARLAARHPGETGDARLLVVLFPHDQLHVYGFHRIVRDLGGRTPAEILAAVEKGFTIEALDASAAPGARGRFTLVLGGRAYALTARPPLDEPDAAIAQHRLLEPALGVHDPRDDPRLEFAPGVLPPGDAAARAAGGLCLTLHPVAVEEMMEAADRAAPLPPKSTYFDPKARSGVFVRLRPPT